MMRWLTMLCLLTSPATAEDWPCWRGPNRDGISTEKDWLSTWPKKGPKVAWKAKVELGFSSVVVSDGKLLTMGHRDGQDIVFCLNAKSGAKIWTFPFKSEKGAKYFEGGTCSTPTIDGERAFVLSRWGDLFCLNLADGRKVWGKKLDMPLTTWGFAGSPVVHEKMLLLNVGESGMALNKENGKILWSSPKEEAGYSTPLPYRKDGEWRAIFSSGRGYSSVRLKDGKVLWQHLWITRYGVNASDPILKNDQVLISTGYSKGATLIKIKNGETETVWRNRNLRNQMNSSVLLDGYVYGIDGDGGSRGASLKCVEWSSGKVLWTERSVRCGSLMAADGKLIVLSESGKLIIAKVSPKEFKPLSSAQVLNAKCWTVPVLAHGRIYCRDVNGNLVCLDVQK